MRRCGLYWRGNGSKIGVLLADDVAEIRLIVRLALESDGRFHVLGEAGDGAEAVRLAEEPTKR